MPEKDHAVWDIFDGLPHREGPQDAPPAQHARARAGIFEEASRNPDSADIAMLIAEARQRTPRLRPAHGHSLWRFSRTQRALLAFSTVLFTALLTLFVIMLLQNSNVGLAPFAMLFAAVTQAVIAARILHRPHLRRAAGGHCPDCNDDLTASPRPFPPSTLEGLDLGPARCPECGAFWPLVPPAP